jgi:hypothetical protein
MKILEHQVGAVIKTYLKNRKGRLENVIPFREYSEVNDNVNVSEEAKRVLYERLGKQVIEKAKKEISSR